MLSKAIEIANRAHAGQADKNGAPYILHPLRVMLSMKNEFEMVCAILHDVVEDSGITFDDLRKEGFTEDTITVLDSLTRRGGEKYEDYVGRILENKTACRIKLADLRDNMDLTRIESLAEADVERVKKYVKAFKRISEVLPV